MQWKVERRQPQDVNSDVLFIAADKDWDKATGRVFDSPLRRTLREEVAFQRFAAREGEVATFQTHGAAPWRYVVLVGCGNPDEARSWYAVAQTIQAKSRELRAHRSALWLSPALSTLRAVEFLAEGTTLAAYRFEGYRQEERSDPAPTLLLLGTDSSLAVRQACTRGHASAAATNVARDLITTPAAVATPIYLANAARRIARSQKLQLRVLDEDGIRRAGMGALLGVAQGSTQPPRFIELIYKPAKKATARIALVGKGITFDSGGLSLKPADSMQSQKRDMAGAGAVLGAMSAVRTLGIRAEVRAYIPSAENMPSGSAIRPGDVVRAANGKSIEVLNTDAEGRLVLADALSYAAERRPDVIIDLATLTAAVRIALGARYAGIMGDDGDLVHAVIAAGKDCGENLWQLPLAAEYRPDIDSQVADLKNIGEGGTGAGTIIGGLFLREFVGDVPWCHIDFSSTVVTDKPFPGHPRGATGFGVRTLLRYLRGL